MYRPGLDSWRRPSGSRSRPRTRRSSGCLGRVAGVTWTITVFMIMSWGSWELEGWEIAWHEKGGMTFRAPFVLPFLCFCVFVSSSFSFAPFRSPGCRSGPRRAAWIGPNYYHHHHCYYSYYNKNTDDKQLITIMILLLMIMIITIMIIIRIM